MDYFSLFAGIAGFERGIEDAQASIESYRKQQENAEAGRCGCDIIPEKPEPEQPTQWGDIAYSTYKQIRNNHTTHRKPSLEEQCQPQLSTCVGYSEIDRYASAIYRYHYPEAKNYGDATKIDYRGLPDFGLLTFGWPCQDNSIAGQRAGQRDGTRSGLLSIAVEILRIKKPRLFVAENVPGLFSVNEGYDFYETIRLFAEAGYDIQWQVLNTRWFLPQNRERIYFVGHLRGTSRPQVFPIGETTEVYREADGAIACAIDANYGKGWLDHGQRTMVIKRLPFDTYDFNDIPNAIGQGAGRFRSVQCPLITRVGELYEGSEAGRIYSVSGISPSLRTPSGGHDEPLIIAPTIRSEHHNTADVHFIAQPIPTPERLKKRQNGRHLKEPDEPMFSLTGQDIHGVIVHNLQPRKADRPSLAYSSGGSGHLAKTDETTYPVDTGNCQVIEIPDTRIRRLTPRECERLQGFPDDWTRYGLFDDGVKDISDTQRYKCTGNAVSVPVVKEVMLRLLSK